MFGYVITNNNVGTESGFWSPLPRVMVWLSDQYYTRVSMYDRHGNVRYRWDWWTVRQELHYRRYGD